MNKQQSDPRNPTPKPSDSHEYLGKEERTIRMYETLLYKKTLPVVIAQDLENGLLDKILAKKNRNQVKQNRCTDYKNEKFLGKGKRFHQNKQHIRSPRRYARGFLLEK